jgi:hypothetical protein
MNLSEIVSISKMTGLFLVVKKRADGLIVKSLIDDKTTFVSQRSNMFTPLDNITIYTHEEPIELKLVFLSMKEKDAQNISVDPRADGAALRGYMSKIVPNYDEEKVYTSDIVKLVKWYNILKSKNMLDFEESTPVVEEAVMIEEVKDEKPKAKKTKKKEENPNTEPVAEEKPKAKRTKKADK